MEFQNVHQAANFHVCVLLMLLLLLTLQPLPNYSVTVSMPHVSLRELATGPGFLCLLPVSPAFLPWDHGNQQVRVVPTAGVDDMLAFVAQFLLRYPRERMRGLVVAGDGDAQVLAACRINPGN